MFELFDFSLSDYLQHLHEALTPDWFQSIHNGFSLSEQEIAQSVHEASVFFNMDDPSIIAESWTTGVMTNSPDSLQDDVLIFNRDQMTSMGITDKMGFDLVMTHEAAHRALDGLELNFNSHQEELCCDFMAGVRAGLNGLDEYKMEISLGRTNESMSHPGGVDRVIAIEKGVAFAQKYMLENDGEAPSFANCLDEFNGSSICEHAAHDISSIIDSSIHGINDIAWLEHQVRISSGSEQLHWAKELDWARSHCFVDVDNQFSSGFDAEHPMLTFEQLRNAGFSNHMANQILYGDNHVYSQRELFEVLYSEHPLEAYNQMIEAKAAAVLSKADALEQEISEQFGIHAFIDDEQDLSGHRGRFGNASGDYIDDSHPEGDLNTFKGLHVNDRAWNMKQSADYAERERKELHEAKLDADAGRMREAAEHTRKAASYHSMMEDYKHAASICTK